jgi:uncharacterized protein (DUF2147 family)
MNRIAIALSMGLACATSFAQMTPVGLWQTISDTDGKVSSEVRITETAGVVTAKIEKLLRADAKPGAKCTECKDDRKDQPILGLEIMRGLKKTEGKDVWEGGFIIDPDNGKDYRARITMIEGGKKLEMRGYIGNPLFGRTQTWVRAQ